MKQLYYLDNIKVNSCLWPLNTEKCSHHTANYQGRNVFLLYHKMGTESEEQGIETRDNHRPITSFNKEACPCECHPLPNKRDKKNREVVEYDGGFDFPPGSSNSSMHITPI